MGEFLSGQKVRAVNPLSKGFSGSNPLSPTTFHYPVLNVVIVDLIKLGNSRGNPLRGRVVPPINV